MENKEPYSGAKLCIQEKVAGDQGLFWAWGSRPSEGRAGDSEEGLECSSVFCKSPAIDLIAFPD